MEKIKRLDIKSYLNPHKLKKIFLGLGESSGILKKLIIYILLIGMSYVFLYPLIKMVSMSFMAFEDLVDPEVTWIPNHLNLNNFKVANFVLEIFPPSWTASGLTVGERLMGTFKDPGNLFKSLRNVGVLAFVQTVVAAMTGFAFARFNFKFKKFWFFMVIVTFVIPLPMVTMPRMQILSFIQDNLWVPVYDSLFAGNFLGDIFNRLIFNTLIPQIFFAILGQGINSAILVLIFYNFFKMIPRSLDEAARIDGATSLQVFYQIYVKLVIPIVTVVFLFAFIWNWNDSYSAQVYFSTGNPLIISRLALFDSDFASMSGGGVGGQMSEALLNEGYKTAATFLSILPLLIIYMFAQKKFIEGIERTGITGE